MTRDYHLHDLFRVLHDYAPYLALILGSVVGSVVWGAKQILVSHTAKVVGETEARLTAKIDQHSHEVNKAISRYVSENSKEHQSILTVIANLHGKGNE